MPVWSVSTSALLLLALGFINWNSEGWKVVVTVLFLGLGFGFLHLFRSSFSFFFSSSSSSSSSTSSTAMAAQDSQKCAVCSKPSSKQCARCKSLRYCSTTCQSKHWKSEHKRKCQEAASSAQTSHNYASFIPTPPHKTRKLLHQVLFPYDDFLKLFNSDKQLFPPCGLLNCGNTCFANVILQCLAHTRPLVAYLLDKGHRKDCRRNQWCFLCDLQQHMETATRCRQPFSPITILSRLPTIGGNLGNGRQEDAHEFMRFAIDKMQSVCLDEHGGEKLIHPKSQETTLIQHIFGGQLQSQVVCTQCNQVSRQYENMLDLTVEIQGDATLLEECLNQFTMKEWLHGDNLYKCDRCNDYVRAWKRLTIQQAPNILTIALKRFQSGRFGKINKRITFPENLDLSPYMSEGADGTDIYKLYAVVVHVDMLNASFFGHYICYTKGFQGEWYRIDDCKVTRVELDEVLSQGAYMLMYSRVSARPTCLKTLECSAKQKVEEKADFGASHGNVQDLGVMNPVSALPANGDSDVQCSYEVCDSSCGTSDNAPIAYSISDGCISTNVVPDCGKEIVKQGHRCEKEACVGGNENDENVGVVEEGGDEESRCCGREDDNVCGRGEENGKDGVEMELDDGKVKEHGSVVNKSSLHGVKLQNY